MVGASWLDLKILHLTLNMKWISPALRELYSGLRAVLVVMFEFYLRG